MNTPLRIRYLLRSLALVAGFVLLHIAAAETPAGEQAPRVTTPASTALQFNFWAQGRLGPLNLFIVGHSEDIDGDPAFGLGLGDWPALDPDHTPVKDPDRAGHKLADGGHAAAPLRPLPPEASPASELATLSLWLVGLGALALAMWRQQARSSDQTCGEDTAIMD